MNSLGRRWKIPGIIIAGGMFMITAFVAVAFSENSSVKALEAQCGVRQEYVMEEYEVKVLDPILGLKIEIRTRQVPHDVPIPCPEPTPTSPREPEERPKPTRPTPPSPVCQDECQTTFLNTSCVSETTFRNCEPDSSGCNKLKGSEIRCPSNHTCDSGACKPPPGSSVGPSYSTEGLIRLTVGYGSGKEGRPGGVSSPLTALTIGQGREFYVHWEIAPLAGKSPDFCWAIGSFWQGKTLGSTIRGEEIFPGFTGPGPARSNNGSGLHNFQVGCRWSGLTFIGSSESKSNTVSVQYEYNPVQPGPEPGPGPESTPECTPCSTLGWSYKTKLCRDTDRWEECILQDGKLCLSSFSCSASFSGTTCDTSLAGQGRCIGSQPPGGCTSDSQCPSIGDIKQRCENRTCIPTSSTPQQPTTFTPVPSCLSHGDPNCGNCDGQCGTTCTGTCSKNSSIKCSPPPCAIILNPCSKEQSGSSRPCPGGGNQTCYAQPNGAYEWTACPAPTPPPESGLDPCTPSQSGSARACPGPIGGAQYCYVNNETGRYEWTACPSSPAGGAAGVGAGAGVGVCTGPLCGLAECSDKNDNDGDKKTDYPADSDCAGYLDNSEGFKIREIIPDFFNLNWFKLNIANFLNAEALAK